MNKLILSLILAFSFTCFEVEAQQAPQPSELKTGDEKIEEEYRRKVAEVEEKNKRIEENNQKIKQALTDGVRAFDEKNYRLAVEKFDEGFSFAPVFWGTAPVLLNNKGTALMHLGAEAYNDALKTKQNRRLEANRFFLDAILAFKDSQKILENTALPEDEAGKTLIEETRYESAKQLAECFRLLVLTDETRIYEAIEAFENYLKIEKDELLKERAQEKLKKLKAKYKIGS
jgi:hypothetical protein